MNTFTPTDLAQPADGSPEGWLVGGGEMGSLMRSMDWSKTKLGPIEGWPRSLRTMLDVVLGSRFPMLLWWGPDLLHLYNDAYRPILRDKHPASLAAAAAQVWAEVWDLVGPMIRSVQEGGPLRGPRICSCSSTAGRWPRRPTSRSPTAPSPATTGRSAACSTRCRKRRQSVQSERQIRMLHDLVVRAADAKSSDETYRIVTEVLSANELDLPFVLLVFLEREG